MKKFNWSFLAYGVPIFIFIVLPLIMFFMVAGEDIGPKPSWPDEATQLYKTERFTWAFAKAINAWLLIMPMIFTPIIIHHIYDTWNGWWDKY